MKIYLLVMLMFGGCVGDISSKCSIHSGIKWYDIQAVFDSLDPCTPNPCAKGHVCRINEGTYQHYCEVCEPKNGTKGYEGCMHTTSFENLLLMLFSGFYQALPLLRQMPSERLDMFRNLIGQQFLETHGAGNRLEGQTSESKTTNRTTTRGPKMLHELCTPNPCQNGGKCYADVEAHDYFCVCPNKNSGKSCEGYVFSEENKILYGFYVSQITTQASYHIAEYAIDDDPKTVTATNDHSDKPWWQINLRKLHRIHGVTILNRHEEYAERLHDFEVRVGNKSMTSTNANEKSNELCHFRPGGGIPRGASLEIYCQSGPIVGRYLTIQIVKKCTPQIVPYCTRNGDILSLAEVSIYGHALN